MTDQHINSADLTRIDIREDADCRYWSDRLGVSPEELRWAVGEVGPNVDDVTRFLSQGPGDTSTNGASHWRATSGL